MIEKALVNRLNNYSGLTALVGSRVYPLVAPNNVMRPYIVYQKISGPQVHTMGQDPGLQYPRFQFSCWGETYSSVKAVGAQVKAALSDYSGTLLGVVIQRIIFENILDSYEADTGLFGCRLDFLVWYQ